jgi:hypothetical protein
MKKLILLGAICGASLALSACGDNPNTNDDKAADNASNGSANPLTNDDSGPNTSANPMTNDDSGANISADPAGNAAAPSADNSAAPK